MVAQAQDFTKTMTVEERAATGLDRLSGAELEQLKAIVERYKSGEVAAVQKVAEQKVAAAEAKVLAAETKVTSADSGKKQPGWVNALLTLQKTSDKPDEAEVFEDRLIGELRGFDGKRRFRLQGGQVWEMIQADYYSGPPISSPVVTIRPGVLGVYWLKIQEAGLRVKVKLVKVE
ncbi:MAG: hypothetical protein NVV74_10345 [Magnetospirillum sp.]|nr:hypothetical protein [Magnetospirillum sp.]